MTDTMNVPCEPTREMLQACLAAMRADKFRSPKRIWSAMLAAAPKVEQEPVAWQLGHHVPLKCTVTEYRSVAEEAAKSGYTVTPLYTHPAPASDELLEALEVIQDKLKFCTDEGPEGEGWLSKELEQAWDVVSDYINRHKGPQS